MILFAYKVWLLSEFMEELLFELWEWEWYHYKLKVYTLVSDHQGLGNLVRGGEVGNLLLLTIFVGKIMSMDEEAKKPTFEDKPFFRACQ